LTEIKQSEIKLNILQIGANKGNTDNDPVWKLCQENLPESLYWHIILVEPNTKALRIARHHYYDAGFKNVIAYSAGVSDKEEELTLYVDNDVPGNEGSQHASCIKDQILKMGHTENELTEIKIWCYPLTQFMFSGIDYLQIDTEGYDGKILLGYDFKYKPKVIEFELLDLDHYWAMGPNTRFVVSGQFQVSKPPPEGQMPEWEPCTEDELDKVVVQPNFFESMIKSTLNDKFSAIFFHHQWLSCPACTTPVFFCSTYLCRSTT
jgi:FkbM family methyltransferase